LENKKYIAFIGDSLTWGQGLYLPSWVDRKPHLFSEINKKEIQWTDQQDFIDSEDLRIKDELSFTKLVSNKLGRKCVKKPDNGGNNLGNLTIVSTNNRLNVDGVLTDFLFVKKDLILIFQLTHFGRTDIIDYMTEEEKEEILKIDMHDARQAINQLFRNRVKNHFEHIDSTLQKLSEEVGFEYWYLDWVGDFYEFLPHKFIDIKIGNNSGKYFAPLVDNFPIIVKFGDMEIKDAHLNEDANRIIAESILRWLRDKSRGAGGNPSPFPYVLRKP
jgi:lysophospholipase L1-like esterase